MASKMPALDKIVRILDLLSNAEHPMSGADVAKTLDLPRSSAYALLQALLEANLVSKADERQFTLGIHVMHWASAYLSRQDIVAAFHQNFSHCSALDSYTLTLSMLQEDKVVYLACKNSNAPLGFTFRIGMQMPAALTATGKMLLSELSHKEIEQRISHFPPAFTENSVQTLADLYAELEIIRKQGYAIDNGQLRLGMYCYAVAIKDRQGKARYGIAASLLEQETHPETVTNLIQELHQLAEKLGKLFL